MTVWHASSIGVFKETCFWKVAAPHSAKYDFDLQSFDYNLMIHHYVMKKEHPTPSNIIVELGIFTQLWSIALAAGC